MAADSRECWAETHTDTKSGEKKNPDPAVQHLKYLTEDVWPHEGSNLTIKAHWPELCLPPRSINSKTFLSINKDKAVSKSKTKH